MLMEVLQKGETGEGFLGVLLILHWGLLRLMRGGCQGLPGAQSWRMNSAAKSLSPPTTPTLDH